MKRFLRQLAVAFLFLNLWVPPAVKAQQRKTRTERETAMVAQTLDLLNTYAANAAFGPYFNLYADESTFIGTDAGEIWDKKAFMAYAKPHFDKGKAWHFTSLKRKIYFSNDLRYAWFDELLDTKMKLCRGSGVLEKINGEWKIRQYVLSMTVPNEIAAEVTAQKTETDNLVIQNLKN